MARNEAWYHSFKAVVHVKSTKLKKPLETHFNVETGMNRIGCADTATIDYWLEDRIVSHIESVL